MMQMVKRNILLTPGPATTTDTVKYAQVMPDICPREKEFGLFLHHVCCKLTCIPADSDRYSTVLFGGSGTAAVESILSSVVRKGDLIVIVNNGAYGKRMCEIAEVYGLKYLVFHESPHVALDLAALESLLDQSLHPVTHLAVVHHETTTGLLNDIVAIGEICRRRSIKLIVDAISSFAAIPIQMKAMNIHYLAASSNKNLQAMPGISFVIAESELLQQKPTDKPCNYYLNLFEQYEYFRQTLQTRFTPPVQTIYALNQAIDELNLEGMEQRYLRYQECWETLIEGIQRIGLRYISSPRLHSKLVTSIFEPELDGYSFKEMHDFLLAKGYTIYPGKMEDFNTFRVANIGDITRKDMEDFMQLLESYFRKILKLPSF
jgi:2-aminoethylphosphonate aminotransferase